MSSKIFDKLKKVNSEKDVIRFKMEYKGEVIHESSFELTEYLKEIVEDEDGSFYYFFKETSNKFEDLVNDLHKKKMWKQIEKKSEDGSEK